MMKPSDDEYTSKNSVTSPSKDTARPHRSRPILHLFLEREDTTGVITMDKPPCLMKAESNRDKISSQFQTSHDSDKVLQGESIIQKFRPMLQLFFEREREKNVSVQSKSDPGKEIESKGSSPDACVTMKSSKNSTSSVDETDSVWRSYRRDTLSRNGSDDLSKNGYFSTNLRRRSSLGVAASITSAVSLSLGSLNEKSETGKVATGSKSTKNAEQNSRWYKNKMFLMPACILGIIVFCLLSAVPLARTKNSSSTKTSITYNHQQPGGTSDNAGSTSSQHPQPSKQPSTTSVGIPTNNGVRTTMPQSHVGENTGSINPPSPVSFIKPVAAPTKVVIPTKSPVSVPTKKPIAYPTKAPVSSPTKLPITPTTATQPSSIQTSVPDCFLTSEVTCTDALNPSLPCTTLISNWKNKGSPSCVTVNIRYNFRICNIQTDASVLLSHATSKVNGIQTTDLIQLGKNTVMSPRECRMDFRTWTGKVFCYNGLIQNQSYASLWIAGVNNKGSNCTDFNKFIYSSL